MGSAPLTVAIVAHTPRNTTFPSDVPMWVATVALGSKKTSRIIATPDMPRSKPGFARMRLANIRGEVARISRGKITSTDTLGRCTNERANCHSQSIPFRVIDRYTPDTHWVAFNKASVTCTAGITGNVMNRALRATHQREWPNRIVNWLLVPHLLLSTKEKKRPCYHSHSLYRLYSSELALFCQPIEGVFHVRNLSSKLLL